MTTTASCAPQELAFQLARPRPQAPRRPAAERRRDIVRAAVDSIAAEGLAALRVEDIAQRCGVAKTTVYLYFRTRDELVLEAVRWIIDEHFRPLLEPMDDMSTSLSEFLVALGCAAEQAAVQAVFAGGPASVAAESAAAGEVVHRAVSELVSRFEQLAEQAGAERAMIALAPVLVPGMLVSSAWSRPPCCDTLLNALCGGVRLDAA